jgi:hypothetical protein
MEKDGAGTTVPIINLNICDYVILILNEKTYMVGH